MTRSPSHMLRESDTATRTAPAFFLYSGRAIETYFLTLKLMSDNHRRWIDFQNKTASLIVEAAQKNADAVTTAEDLPALTALATTRIADGLACSTGAWHDYVATTHRNQSGLLEYFGQVLHLWRTPTGAPAAAWDDGVEKPVETHAESRAQAEPAHTSSDLGAAAAARKAIALAKIPTRHEDAHRAAKPTAI